MAQRKIIVVDDGYKDRTLEFARPFIKLGVTIASHPNHSAAAHPKQGGFIGATAQELRSEKWHAATPLTTVRDHLVVGLD
jgi:hypothetical protein